MLALAFVKTTAATEFSSGSCTATVKTQFLYLEKLPPCFHCFNELSRIYPVRSFTKNTDRVLSLSTKPMLLPFRSYTSTVSGCIMYFVCFQPLLKVVYQSLHIPFLPIFVGLHNIGPYLQEFVESGRHESPKHVASAHCQQRIVISAHALVKFLNLQVIGPFNGKKVQISSTSAFTTSLLWPYSDFSLSQPI